MAGARPLRDNPYTGPSQMAAPSPASEPETSTPPAATGRPKAAPRPPGRADGKGGGSDAAPATRRTPTRSAGTSTSTRPSTNWTPPTVVSDVSGFVLGLLVWGWVVLPFLQHGPSGPRDVLRAKFLNKAPDGSWLP